MASIRHISDLARFKVAIFADGDIKNGFYSIPSQADVRDAGKLIELYKNKKIKESGTLKKPDKIDDKVMTHFVSFEGGPGFLLG